MDTPSSRATSTLAAPSAARRTIRARIAMRCSVVPARVSARKASASDSLTANAGAGCAAMHDIVCPTDS
jgi:hypothetical protein